MVPNHMGIDARWVIEHPERFISLEQPPYALYSYTGENLSEDPRVEIYLEDHYYDQTETAEVFKRVEMRPGACATSTTATTAPPSPGMTRRSWTSPARTSARR